MFFVLGFSCSALSIVPPRQVINMMIRPNKAKSATLTDYLQKMIGPKHRSITYHHQVKFQLIDGLVRYMKIVAMVDFINFFLDSFATLIYGGNFGVRVFLFKLFPLHHFGW